MSGATEPAKRVLLVEDNYDNRTIYRDILEHAGYEVEEAANGREGLDLAMRAHPDLILMDLSMPVQNGWETLDRLKAIPELAGIPVIALSAHVLFEGDYERAIQRGFVGYLTKPVEPWRVLEVVKSHVGAPAAQRN